MTRFLAFVLVLGLSILVVAAVGWGAPAPGQDATGLRFRSGMEALTLSLSVHNRAFTLAGFSPRLSLINEQRDTNAQTLDYDRNRAELSFVRQF